VIAGKARDLEGALQHGLVDRRDGGVPGGPVDPEPAEKILGPESGGTDDTSAGGERGQQAGDEAVNMEERHDAEASVPGFKAEAFGDVSRRSGQVDPGEGNELGFRRRPRRMEEKRDAFRRREPFAAGPDGRREGEPERAGFLFRTGFELDDRNSERPGRVDGDAFCPGLDDQGARFEVGQVEIELRPRIVRIERGRGGRGHRGEEGDGHFGAVGKDDGGAVVRSEAGGAESFPRLSDDGLQTGVGKRLSARREDGG